MINALPDQEVKMAEEYCFNLQASLLSVPWHCSWILKCLFHQVDGEWPADLFNQDQNAQGARELPSVERTKDMVAKAGLNENASDFDQRFTLDARQCGNVARFTNHSSAPNLFVQMVCSESWDLRQPHLCLFASCRIPQFTELYYDYGTEYASLWLNASEDVESDILDWVQS